MRTEKVHINLKVAPAAAAQLLRFHQQRLTELLREMKALESEIDHCQAVIASIHKTIPDVNNQLYDTEWDFEQKRKAYALLQAPGCVEDDAPAYSSGLPLVQKAVHVLSGAGCVLTSREIALRILEKEPNILDTHALTGLNHFNSRLSATLKQKVDAAVLFNRLKPEGDKDFLYGLREWFDGKGKLKPQFRQEA